LKTTLLPPALANLSAESKALIDFIAGPSNIALVLNFSTENTFLNLEQTGEPGPRARESGSAALRRLPGSRS